MMTMYLRNKKEKKKTVLVVVSILGVLLLGGLLYPFSFSGAPRVSLVARALWSGERSVAGSLGVWYETVLFRKDLASDNEMLRQRILELEAQELSASLRDREYEYLLERVGRMNDAPRILAGVLTRPNRSPYDTIILDAGVRHGVEVGNLVLGYEHVVLGSIREVFDTSSKAVLFSTPGVETEGLLATPRVAITLVGRGGGTFEATITRSLSVVVGTEVLSSGAEPLLLGTVEKVLSDPRDPFQKILISAPVPLSALDVVFIQPR